MFLTGMAKDLPARRELLALRKMLDWLLDFRPTTSRRSDKFILAVDSPLLSPVCIGDDTQNDLMERKLIY